MYYVELEMKTKESGIIHIGTTRTDDLGSAVSQLTAYRDTAEMLVCAEVIQSYDLRLGTIPNSMI